MNVDALRAEVAYRVERIRLAYPARRLGEGPRRPSWRLRLRDRIRRALGR